MTMYETLRIIFCIVQAIATIVAPLLVVFYMERRRKGK
jgi:hypothetical protein